MTVLNAVLTTGLSLAWTSRVFAQSTYASSSPSSSSSSSSSSLTSSYAPLASCSSTLTAGYATPSVAPGFVARLVAQNLTSPRGIKFDNEGALLVVEQDKGITALTLVESGTGCWSVSSRKTVINDTSLNHGIELSPDGNTLYASSGETLWSWSYSSASQTNTSAPRALVTGMAGSDHTSRTLLLSKKAPGMIIINRGSNSNIDPLARDITTGHSQIKAFNLTNLTSSSSSSSSAAEPYDFNTAGLLLGWGLRNDVGIAEEPQTGGIYSVENSADQITRDDIDIHTDNPAEELNFLGYLDGTFSPNQGRNFGYPTCFTAWNTSAIPNFSGTTTVGAQFTIDASNTTLNDTLCSPSSSSNQPPRLAFPAHTAPLDILFNPTGTTAWITLHGSWNRASPIGYKLIAVAFRAGEPASSLEESGSAMTDVVSNADVSLCGGSSGGCFRPVGLAWDDRGRLWMSSDATGEVFVVLRGDDGGGVADVAVGGGGGGGGGAATPTTTTGSSGGSSSSMPSSTNLAAARRAWAGSGGGGVSGVLAVGFAVWAFLL